MGLGQVQTNGEDRREFGKSEGKKKREGKYVLSLLWQASPSGGQESFMVLAFTGWVPLSVVPTPLR